MCECSAHVRVARPSDPHTSLVEAADFWMKHNVFPLKRTLKGLLHCLPASSIVYEKPDANVTILAPFGILG